MEEEEEEEEERADSLSISVDWGALPSNLSISNGSLSSTPTVPSAGTGGAGGGGGGSFSFAPVTPAGGGMEGEEEGKEPSPTLVSLPLMYSARADTAAATEHADSAAHPDPHHSHHHHHHHQTPHSGATPQTTSSAPVGGGMQKVKTQPLSVETLKPILTTPTADVAVAAVTPVKKERGVASGSLRGTPASGMRGWYALCVCACACVCACVQM